MINEVATIESLPFTKTANIATVFQEAGRRIKSKMHERVGSTETLAFCSLVI